MKIITLLLTLILTSCDSNSQNPDILLTGKIGEFDAQMTLRKDGDFYNGLFTYKTENNKQIKLKGQIENDLLRITEFNNENEITGLFLGKYSESEYNGEWSDVNGKTKIPFLFRKSKELISLKEFNTKGVTKLKSKELLDTYFEAKEYKTDSIATFITNKESYEIEFHKFENYVLAGKQYSLAIFGNYPLYDYLGDGNLDRGMTTSTLGDSAFSVIKFVKKGDNWVFVNMVKKFDTGVTPLDHLPKIKQIGDYTFLETNNIYKVKGAEDRSTKFFNILNFQESLIINSETNEDRYIERDGDLDELIKEINGSEYNSIGEPIDREGSYIGSLFISNAMHRFTIHNKKLLCIVDYISVQFDKKKKELVQSEKTITYAYNKHTMKFVEIK